MREHWRYNVFQADDTPQYGKTFIALVRTRCPARDNSQVTKCSWRNFTKIEIRKLFYMKCKNKILIESFSLEIKIYINVYSKDNKIN